MKVDLLQKKQKNAKRKKQIKESFRSKKFYLHLTSVKERKKVVFFFFFFDMTQN